MADLNDSLKDSYISKVGAALTPYAADLTAKGFDPASRIAQLSGAGPLIESANKLRKAAEKSAADAIAHEQEVRSNFYSLATNTVSLVEGLLGKNHELCTKLRKLRADLIGNQNTDPKPVTPTPAK